MYFFCFNKKRNEKLKSKNVNLPPPSPKQAINKDGQEKRTNIQEQEPGAIE